MEKRDFACEIFDIVSHDFLVKEGILQSESFSTLYNEVFGGILDSKNVEAVSKCNGGSNRPSRKHNKNGVSNKSLKRKAKKERSKRSSPSKKHYNNNNNNNNIIEQEQEEYQPAELPMAFKERIEEMEGGEVKLVIEKELTKSDLNPNNGRFSIPKRKIREKAKNFLTPTEESSLDVREVKGKNKRLTGLSVSLLDPNLKLCDNMCFKKWEMDTAEVYNITRGWNHLVSEHRFKANDKVQLWSFRTFHHHQLYFALVKL